MKKVECFDISHRRDVVRECKGSPTLCARMGTGGNNVPIVLMDQGGDVMSIEQDKVGTLRAQTHGHEPVVFENCDQLPIPIDTMNLGERKSDTNGLGVGDKGDPSYTLTKSHSHGVAFDGCVRRLTPVECERLQGFPDGYTQIPYRGKPAEQCPDAPRYKALGNSWAVPVVRWIGKRIDEAMSGGIL